MYVSVYVCAYKYVCMYVCMHVCMFVCMWGVSRKLATFEKMTVTGMHLRDLNVLLLHYPFMSNPRYCVGCAT